VRGKLSSLIGLLFTEGFNIILLTAAPWSFGLFGKEVAWITRKSGPPRGTV